jgi:hypothetical protein
MRMKGGRYFSDVGVSPPKESPISPTCNLFHVLMNQPARRAH